VNIPRRSAWLRLLLHGRLTKSTCSRLGLGEGRGRGEQVEEVSGMKYTRITVEPDKMGGVPCVRGLRIPVATIVGMVADGMTQKQILKAYPDLEPDDIRQALKYAADAVTERELPLVGAP